MKTKQEILAEIHEGLDAGIITEADLKTFVAGPITERPAEPLQTRTDKTSAVDIMFYIAGLVLYLAILSIIAQSWGDGNTLMHILLSVGVGLGLWAIAYYLVKNLLHSDVRKGLINSLLLTGSLSIITGGYIVTNEIIGGFDEVNFIPGAIILALVGAVHIAFDKLIRRNVILLMGILLCVAAFPALLFGVLRDADLPADVWSGVVILSAGLLAYATRTVAKMDPDRQIRRSFDSFAVFLTLAVMYMSSFGDYGLLWLLLLVAGVLVIFYLSIVTHDKNLLGSASFFLVLTVMTISFKYFSGYGVTTSLILATVGLLGSAAVATTINKKYFT